MVIHIFELIDDRKAAIVMLKSFPFELQRNLEYGSLLRKHFETFQFPLYFGSELIYHIDGYLSQFLGLFDNLSFSL